MPSEAKKLGEVTVAIMQDHEGKHYLHVVGEALLDYVTVWNEQMNQAREEERAKVLEELGHHESSDAANNSL